MEIVLRAGAMYVLILAFMRLSGKRTIAQITMFDFILLLIVSEATQQALLGDDYSITGGALAVLTLILLDRLSDNLSSPVQGGDRALHRRRRRARRARAAARGAPAPPPPARRRRPAQGAFDPGRRAP